MNEENMSSLENKDNNNLGEVNNTLETPSNLNEVSSINNEGETLNNNLNYNDINSPLTNSSNPNNDLIPPKSNKKGFKIGLVIIIIIILALGGFLAYYFFLAKNPTDVLKDTINNVYADFSANLKKLENKTIDLDIFNDPFKINGTAQISGSMFEGLKNDKINYELGLDYKNEKAELSAGLVENNKNLLDASLYFMNDHYYLKSNSLIDNTYDLGEFNFSDNFDLSKLEDILKETKELPKVEDIDYILKEFKDALISSLNKEDMEQSKEKLTINDISVNTNKIVYELNQNSIAYLMTSLAKALETNDSLLTKLSELTQTDKKELKESLAQFQNSDTYKDIEGTGTFVVYTTGITNKFAGFELNMDKTGQIAYYNASDNAYLIMDIDDVKMEVTSVKKSGVMDIRVLLTEDSKKEEIAKLTVRSLDMDNIDFDLEINTPEGKVNGTVKLTTKKNNDQEISGNLKFSISAEVDGQSNDLQASLSYTLKIGENIANINPSNALSIDNPTMEDTNKMKQKLEELKDTEIYDFIKDYLPIEETSYDQDLDIYDDTTCFDAYFDQDIIDNYEEYYNTYCKE